MDFIICILLVSICAAQGLQIMEQSGQSVLARTSTSVDLPCTVDSDYNADEMTLFWYKIQNRGVVGEALEELQVSVARILTGDFKETQWYSGVAIENVGANKRFTLQLRNVRPEESGEYICRVQDHQNLLGEIKYHLNVYDPIDSVVVHGVTNAAEVDMNPDLWDMESWTHMQQLEYADRNPGFYACVARGVYPEPDMRVFIDDELISGRDFQKVTRRTLTGETPGQRKYMANTVVYTRDFPDDASNDGMDVICEAVVEDSNGQALDTAVRVTSKLMLQARPELNCSSEWRTPIGTEDFQIYCDVISKPQPSSVEFYGSETSDRIRLGDPGRDDFRVSMEIHGDGWRVMLTISEMKADYFQGYQLTVRNEHGSSEKVLTIIVGQAETGPIGAASLPGAQSILVLLLVAMAAARLC